MNVEDFKSILQRRNTPNNFNLPTREFLNEFLKQVDEIKTETLKDAENLRAREAESFEKQKMEAQFSTASTPNPTQIKEQIPQELQEQWIKEFNLQSIDDTFVPSFKPEVKEALAKAGVTEDIKLTRGSLLKLIERNRQEFLPYIKETLENSDAIIKDKENVIIFAKDIGHTSYFTSVAKDNKGEWVITTNSYKTINQLKNRVNADGELLYLSKEAPNILAEAFTAKTFPSELESNSTTNLSKEQILNNLQDVRFRDTKVKETENDTITRNNHTDNPNNSNISNTNTLDSHLHTTPQGNERVMGDISTQSRVHREGRLRESQELSDIRFTDTKGKEHTLTKETQEQWLKTFGLENLEQSYIPKHSEEIKQALGGKEIRLQKGSLLKLVSQGREEFIPQIKAVLDEPEAILRDSDNSFLFIKHLKDEDYFVNVSIDKGEYAVSISNGIKESNNLKNKLDSGAKVLYQSPNASSNLQTLLQASRYSTNKIDNVDSTTNLSKSEVSSATLSPFARAEAEKQARLEIQAKEEAQRELQREARREEIKENQRILQEQKDKESGQSSLNREVDLGDNIKVREIKAPTTSVTLGNNEVLELKYVVVKQEDLKTNFNGNALQPRTQSNPAMIERIATQFKPNLVIGRGGFEDLPILAPDGQVIAGNHRVEGMKQFNQASRKRYEDAIKESFGVELKSDELLLRMPKDELENQKLVSLAFVSNANTNLTYGDKVMASLGKYAKELEMMPRYFGSESVDELSTKVAKSLENNGLLPNEEEANLALLGHLAKNSNGENIASVLTRIYQNNNRENFTKIKDMFVKNAGAFHNLINDTGENGLKNLELRPYLLDSINATSQSLRGTRADNFKKLVEKIENVLKTTDENGSNVILQQDSEYYKNLIGEILGASLAKFARQENPANALYEVLKNAKADLIEELSPTLFKEGKGIEKADIYDFLELLISKGEASEVTSRVIDLLPALKEKEKAFNEYIKNNNLDKRVKEIENGKYSNGNNNNFDTSSSGSDRQKMGADRDIGRRNNGDESTEMGGLRAGEEKQAGDSEATKREVGTRDTATKTRATNLQETKEQIPQELQEQWIKEFNLQSIDDTFVPSFKPEVKEALEKAGISDDFHLKIGSLIKLNNRQRQEFLPYIKPTIQEPNLVLDNGRGILFIKEFIGEDKNRYFMSVAKDYNGEWIFSTHTRKELKDIQKEVKKSKIFYNKGFKGEEVAGASDILESGGTTTKPSDLQIKYPANHSSGINPKDNSSTKELSLSKAQAKKQEILNRVLTKKQEQLAKLEKQYQEAIAKENSRPIPPPNQSNNSRRAADRALSTRIKNLLSKIEDKKNEIILLDPNASKKEKYIAQRGQTYYNSMLRSYENFTKNKQVFLDKDIFKTDLLGFGINSNPQALREFRNFIEHNFNITPLKDFGINYAEFYRDGQGAIAKILSEAKDYEARKEAGKLTQAEIEQGAYKGQVAGAFYKEELGDIDLVWGVEGSSKSDGWGLAKIAKYHPEVLGKLDDLIQDLPIVKETPNRYQLENDDYKIAIRKDFEGQSRNWVLTAFEKKESIARRRTDLPSTESATKKTTLVNAKEDSTTNLFKQQDIDFKSFEDFSKYAKLSGIEFESEAQAREAHKYIQSRLKDLEC